MRLAGTWKQYSKNAMPQLITTTAQSGAAFSRPEAMCPYQAKVMKTFEIVSSSAVFTRGVALGRVRRLGRAGQGLGLLLRERELRVALGAPRDGGGGLLRVLFGQQGEVAQERLKEKFAAHAVLRDELGCCCVRRGFEPR